VAKQKNYPLYETTVFEDFRIMTENVADRFPDKVAFSFKKNVRSPEVTRVTFSEVREYTRGIGTEMLSLGAKGKTVAIMGENGYDWVASYFALMSVGAVTVPLDKDLSAEELTDIIQKAACSFVFYGPSVEDKAKAIAAALPEETVFVCMGQSAGGLGRNLSDIAADGAAKREQGDNSYYDNELDPDKLASIVFTSGTTGKGKGVMLSQTNIVSDMTQGMYNFHVKENTLHVLPPHHTFGSTVNYVGHYAQGLEVYISSGIRYVVQEMKEQQPEHLILVPLFLDTMYKKIWATAEKQGKAALLRRMMKVSDALRKVGIDLRRTLFKSVLSAFGGKLELIICGGAPLNQDIADCFDSLGITILNGYGITECAPLISANRNKYQKKGSVGTPIIGEQVKIADPDENGEGEICVKGPNVMLGYFNDPEATAAAFDEEGFFRTGDYGRLDEEGWIYITGRLKNLIIFKNGKNVYPEEIETDISGVPGVNEVVVYAGESASQPDREAIVAEIYPDFDYLKEHGVDDVQAYFEDAVKKINQKNVSYKTVHIVKIRKEEFVKNTMRKILRRHIDKSID